MEPAVKMELVLSSTGTLACAGFAAVAEVGSVSAVNKTAQPRVAVLLGFSESRAPSPTAYDAR